MMVEGYHECLPSPSVSVKSLLREDPALKITDDGRDQLGHLQRELVPVLAYFLVLMMTLSILNHFNDNNFS